MAKVNYHLLVCVVLFFVGNIQAQGIRFSKDKSWKIILAEAKASNKYVFLDCFTTSSVSCKEMNNKIFPLKETGDYFNERFISVQVQMDSTGQDSESIKKWYTDAAHLGKDYQIKGYPAYLFFTSDGKLIHKDGGYKEKAIDFIDVAKKGIRYSSLLKEWKNGKKDSAFLHTIGVAAWAINDSAVYLPVCQQYLKVVRNVYTRDVLTLMAMCTKTSHSPNFNFFYNNQKNIDSICGKGAAMRTVEYVIYQELISPALRKGIGWEKIMAQALKRFPEHGEQVVMMFHFGYDSDMKDHGNFCINVAAFMEKYADFRGEDFGLFNGLAWDVFLYCDDPKTLNMALGWSKKAVAISPQAFIIDTYACLLYKLGRVEEAVIWEEKAVAADPDGTDWKEQLEKMKKGDKIW